MTQSIRLPGTVTFGSGSPARHEPLTNRRTLDGSFDGFTCLLESWKQITVPIDDGYFEGSGTQAVVRGETILARTRTEQRNRILLPSKAILK